MVQLQNFFFFITSMVVPRGTAAPSLLKWFVSRDVLTGALSSNGTIIPIPIPSFLFLVYLHSRKFIGSMDRAKSGVLVKASCPILLPDIIWRSSSARNALFPFVPVLNFLLIESMGDLSYFSSFCGLLSFQFFRTLFSLPRARLAKGERAQRRKGLSLRTKWNEQGAGSSSVPNRFPNGEPHRLQPQRSTDLELKNFQPVREPIEEKGPKATERCFFFMHPHIERRVEGFGPVAFPVPPSSSGPSFGCVPPEIGLEALALPRSRLLMALGHDNYQKVRIHLPISHGGVCIFILGLLLSNTNKIEFTQRLPLGPELNMGKERCCLRGLDHLHGPTSHSIFGNFLLYPTSDRFMFEDDESLRADLLPIYFPASYENRRLPHFPHRWMKKNEDPNFWLTMFPEKRDYFSLRKTTSTTEVAIHTNPLTDLYAPIGTGSSRTGGWYTTIMKLPFFLSLRIGFILASSGGSRTFLRQLQKDKLHWNPSIHNCIKPSGCGASRP